ELTVLERRLQDVALDVVQVGRLAELGDGLLQRLHAEVEPDHVLRRTLAGPHPGLLAAPPARGPPPPAPLPPAAPLQLLLHPADVDVVVEAVAAFALEDAVPARQPLEGVAPAHLGDVVGDLDQARYALVDGVAFPAGGAGECAAEDADGVFL